jgi:hypothetical protein
MKLTKERKIYLTIGAVAILGLAADRFLGAAVTSPQNVAASLQSPGIPAAAPAPVAGNVEIDMAALNLRSDRSLPVRLEHFAQAQGYDLRAVEDGFVASEGWLAKLVPAKADKPGESGTGGGEQLAVEFKSKHKLTALMTGADGGLAVVNGQPLRPGQEIGYFKLVAIRGNQAIFENQGQAAMLELAIDAQKLIKRKAP